MALLDGEIQRIRYELGYHVLTSSAEPYVSYISYFDQIVQPYASAGASTTSTTAVVAASATTFVALTLASATGFSAGSRVVVDVDGFQELATVRSISGSIITVGLKLAHTGTYPVTVEGGESIIREILTKIREVKTEMSSTFGEGAVQRVDEIWFYNTQGSTTFGNLGDQLRYWRDELASALGIRSMWASRAAGAQRLSVY